MSKNTQIGELINYISVNESGDVVLSNGHLVATQNYVSTAVANLVDAAPTTLDTLNELAAALGDDPNFATTVTNSIGGKLSLTGGTLSGALNGTSAVFSSTITASSTGGSGLRIYGAAGTNQWDIYLNSTNLRFSDNTGTGSVVFDRPATFSSSVTAGNELSILGGDGGGKKLYFTGGTTKYNFMIAAQQNVNNALEITPSTAAGGSTFSTPALTIASTGAATFSSSVGVGAAPTNGKLEVQQSTTTAALWVQTGGTSSSHVIADFRTGTNLPALQILGNGTATFGSSITLQSNNALFVNNADNTRSGYLRTSNEGTELSSHNGAGEPLILIAPHSSATMRFYTAGSTSVNERMRITYDGNVLIGTNTSNAALLEVKQPTLAIASIFQAWAPGVAGANFRVISTTGQPYMQYDFNNGKMGVNLSNTLATLATLGGAVQFMGDHRNHQTIIKSAGASGTFSGQLTITIPEMSNASTDGYGAYSCEVYVSGFPHHYCHVWFSGYVNGGITVGETTILRSDGGWSVSQSSFGANNQGFQFIINYPDTFIHPAARIIFNKGGSPNAAEYPANNITAVFS